MKQECAEHYFEGGHTTGRRDYVRGLFMAAVGEIVTGSVAKQNANGLVEEKNNKVNKSKSNRQ